MGSLMKSSAMPTNEVSPRCKASDDLMKTAVSLPNEAETPADYSLAKRLHFAPPGHKKARKAWPAGVMIA